MAEAHAKNHDYHIVDPSPWPFVGSVSAFILAIGAVMTMKAIPVAGLNLGPYVLAIGLIGVLYTMASWWADVINEAEHRGNHTRVVQMHHRYGMIMFIALAVAWGLAFTGFPYAIALKTGNPIAVNNAFLLFFPFAFLTTAYVPQEQMTGWLSTAADYNPVTYLLAGMRSLILEGWDASALGQAFLASAVVGAISFTLAFTALRGRVHRK